MHIKVSLALYLKNKPKAHLGVSGESWTIGNSPMPLDELMHEVVISVVDFARSSGATDVFEAQKAIRDTAAKMIATADKMDVHLEELRQEAERIL